MKLTHEVIGIVATKHPCEYCIDVVRQWSKSLALGSHDTCGICGTTLAVRFIGQDQFKTESSGQKTMISTNSGMRVPLEDLVDTPEPRVWKLVRLDANFKVTDESVLKSIATELSEDVENADVVVDDRIISLVIDDAVLGEAWFWPRHGVLAHIA